MTNRTRPTDPGNTENLFPAADLAKEFPHLFTGKQASWAVRNRSANGLSDATVNIGRRLFIDRDALAKWVYKESAGVGS